jgi:hypothetical protein
MSDDGDKESAIINRHVKAMLEELNENGIEAEATLAFIVIKPNNYNIAMIAAESVHERAKQAGGYIDEDEFCRGLLEYAAKTLERVRKQKAG